MTMRAGDQRMMAALHTFGAIQASSAADTRRLERLKAAELVELVQGTSNIYRLSQAGAAWIARVKGLDSRAEVVDPIVAGKKTLDRGLGLADHEAA